MGINCRNPETPVNRAFPGLFYFRGIKMALPHEIVEFLDGLIGGGGVQVAVCPQCRLDIFMAQPLTHQQHRRPQPDQQGGVGVPVGYNRDKSKIPRGSWGFWDLSLFFFHKKGPEIGVIRGGQKRRATIKDKNFQWHRRESVWIKKQEL